jgi:ankyrin repeat protein
MKFALSALCRELNRLENAEINAVKLSLAQLTPQEINEAWCQGQSILVMAIATQRADVVAAVLAAGANPNADLRGNTPLLLAVASGDSQILQELIKAGADVNAADTQGTTPLIEAVLTGQHDMFAPLMRAGANPLIADKKGQTAMMHAFSERDMTAVNLLSNEQARQKARADFSAAARYDIDDAPEIIIVRRCRIVFNI